MKRPAFANGQIYHVYNRGVDKRKIFTDDQDYLRFIHDLFEFNDEEPALNIYYRLPQLQSYEVQPRKIARKAVRAREKRKLLVEVLVFCLMPNHYHLLLRQLKDDGVIKFMQKLGTGYTMYFNQRYGRVGSLFQGRFKAVLVNRDAHFIHLPYYIHSNPLDLEFPEWRNKEITNYREAVESLENYRWSSFPDYIGKKNFSSVTSREFLLRFFHGPKNYKKETIKWLKEIDLEGVKDLILE